MDRAEYGNLDRVEGDHWFYRGRRRIARFWVRRVRPPSGGDLLVDIGCGTGRFLSEWTDCPAVGMDFSDDSMTIARNRAPGRLARAGLPYLPISTGAASIVTALDVLEHVEDDRGAFREIERVLRPGGIAFLTVPALPMLWSDWDEALHHHRRYTKSSLLAVLPAGLDVVRCGYYNDLSLLPVLLVRFLRKYVGFGRDRRLEDKSPPARLNDALEELFVRLGCLERYRPLLGVSLMLMVRKTEVHS